MNRIFKDPMQEAVYRTFSIGTFETTEELKQELLRSQAGKGQKPESISKALDVLTTAGVIIKKKSFFRDILKPVDMQVLGNIFNIKTHRVGDVWYACRHEHFNFTPDAKLAYTFRIDMAKVARHSILGRGKDPLTPSELISRFGFKRFDERDQKSYKILLGDNALPIKDKSMDKWYRSDERCIVSSKDVKINGIFLTNAVEGNSEYDVIAVMLCKGTLTDDQSKLSPKERLKQLNGILNERRTRVAKLVKMCVDAMIIGEELPKVKETKEKEKETILTKSPYLRRR